MSVWPAPTAQPHAGQRPHSPILVESYLKPQLSSTTRPAQGLSCPPHPPTHVQASDRTNRPAQRRCRAQSGLDTDGVQQDKDTGGRPRSARARGMADTDADPVAAAADAVPRAADRPDLLFAAVPVHQRHAPRDARRRRRRRRGRARARRVLLGPPREHVLRRGRARHLPLGAALWCVAAAVFILVGVWLTARAFPDQVGRRPVLLYGIVGVTAAMVSFGMGNRCAASPGRLVSHPQRRL